MNSDMQPACSISSMASPPSGARLSVWSIILLLLANVCLADEESAPTYLDRYRQSISDCGDTEYCCIRRAKCLIDLSSTIQEDYKKDNKSGIFAFQEFSRLVLSVMDEMTSVRCPGNIQLAFHRFELAHPRHDPYMLTFMRTQGDVYFELFQSLEDAIAVHPAIADQSMDCTGPIPARADFPMPSPAQREFLTIKKAIEDEDFPGTRFYAELYINQHGNIDSANPEVAEVNYYLAMAYFALKRPDMSRIYFEKAANLFEQLNNVDWLAFVLEKLVILYSENLDDLDAATDRAIQAADLHLPLKNGARVSHFAERAAVFMIRQKRIEEAQTLLKRYTASLEGIDADLNVANLRLLLAATFLDNKNTALACEQFETIDALLTARQVEPPERYIGIRGKVNCSKVGDAAIQ